MAFPQQRLRRTRRTAGLRSLVRETRLSPQDFIYPIFVSAGEDVKNPIASMPGIFQLSINHAVEEARRAHELGIPAVLLFGIPDHKDEAATGAYDPEGVVQLATRAIKDAAPELLVVTDVCLCEYTSHGHCGVVEKETGEVLNDVSLELLARTAASQAEAGADVVAPSDMMDGRVAAIRSELDNEGFENTPIMAYAAKYASAFYGPFRDAADSAPQFGDRRSYQMDPANAREALVETGLDIEEGADIVMVKPALPYLDVLRRVRETHRPAPRGVQRERRVRDGQGRRPERMARRGAGRPRSAHRHQTRRGRHHHHLPCPRRSPVAVKLTMLTSAAFGSLFHNPLSHGASPAHPSDLDGLALLEDDGHRAVAARELQHPPAGFLVLLYVVLHEVDPAPLQVLAGGLAVGTASRGVQLYRPAHTSSLRLTHSRFYLSAQFLVFVPPDGYGLRWWRDRERSLDAS